MPTPPRPPTPHTPIQAHTPHTLPSQTRRARIVSNSPVVAGQQAAAYRCTGCRHNRPGAHACGGQPHVNLQLEAPCYVEMPRSLQERVGRPASAACPPAGERPCLSLVVRHVRLGGRAARAHQNLPHFLGPFGTYCGLARAIPPSGLIPHESRRRMRLRCPFHRPNGQAPACMASHSAMQPTIAGASSPLSHPEKDGERAACLSIWLSPVLFLVPLLCGSPTLAPRGLPWTLPN